MHPTSFLYTISMDVWIISWLVSFSDYYPDVSEYTCLFLDLVCVTQDAFLIYNFYILYSLLHPKGFPLS